jgi:hypothetical protein
MLFIAYQRFSLERQRRRRREALSRVQARTAHMREAIAAAVEAKRARTALGEAGADVSGADVSNSSGGSAEDGSGVVPSGLDEQLTPAARVMLSDLDYRRSGGSAASGLEAEREADLAQIRAAVADPPATGPEASSSGVGERGGGGEAAAAPTDARLATFLEEMLRSPEGRRVVRRFRDAQGPAETQQGGSEDDVNAYIEQLLSDPATKARLVAELERRLVEMEEDNSDSEGTS